jgi:hypothetical protein
MSVCVIHMRIALVLLSFAGVFVYNSCTNDDFAKNLAYQSIPPALLVPQPGFPVPGNNGLITISSVSEKSINLLWSRASDEGTPQSDLEYRLYMSESYNINTVVEAQSNGIQVTGWMIDATAATASGLSPGKTYFFNVLVSDRDGNTSAYTTVSSSTPSVAIYLFSTGPYDGNLTSTFSNISPRNAIDDYCITAKKSNPYSTLPCQNVKTFISIDSFDDIFDMPTNYGVPTMKQILGPTGTPIAASWGDLLNPKVNLLDNLLNAKISGGAWWSGSGTTGLYLPAASDTCNGWTSGTGTGMTGKENSVDFSWIYDQPHPCNSARYILCICW